MASRSLTRTSRIDSNDTTSISRDAVNTVDADDVLPVKIILAVDIGSSSTRCSPWVLQRSLNEDQVEGSRAGKDGPSISFGVKPLAAAFIDGEGDGLMRSVRQVRAVHPNTGRIASVPLLLDAVDEVVDETLERLRSMSSSSSSRPTTFAFEVMGIGFTSFVMNLIGVDENGKPVDDDKATLCYACNTPEVAGHVRTLKRYVRRMETRGSSLTRAPPCVTYPCDLYALRSVNTTVQRWQRQLKSENRMSLVYGTTGAPIHASYALAQLRHLYQDHPDVARRVARWQTLPSCCLARWRGVSHMPVSYSEASWTGLLDYRTCQYAACVQGLVPAECWTALPDLRDYNDDPRRGLPAHSPYSERWPELQHTTRFFLGVGDGACATIGSKCTTPNRIACTIGTSAAARICVPLPVTPHDDNQHCKETDDDDGDDNVFVPGLFCYRVDKDRVVVGGALTDGGSVVEWARTLLNLGASNEEAYEACLLEVEQLVSIELATAVEESARQVDTTSSGLVSFVPFLSGERNPGLRETASGCLFGLRRATRPAHVLKSCLEGVTLRINSIVSLLLPRSLLSSSTTLPREEGVQLVASGGALESNPLWRQMLADCTGIPVVFDEDANESTSRGVALMVAQSIVAADVDDTNNASSSSAAEALKPKLVSNPRSVLACYWEQMAQEQNRLLEALTPLYEEPNTA
jgi:gluconokinase